MQVRTGHASGCTHLAEQLAPIDAGAVANIDFIQVTIHCDQALPVIEHNRVAIEEKIAAGDDRSRRRRGDRGATNRRDVHALVRRTRLIVEKTAQAEARTAHSVNGRGK
jgi:hypothetical protein